MRCAFALAALVVVTACTGAKAGHTRPAYVDGCQSIDGRYVVTAVYVEPTQKGRAVGEWKYTWRDTKENTTLTGKLQGLRGTTHFVVTYAHIFVPPGGETFAVFNTAAFSDYDTQKLPSGNAGADLEQLKQHPGMNNRVVIYKKTGEIVKQLHMRNILKDNEWIYVNWVQGNLYWLTEYPGLMKNGEPARCGWRYFQVSPDYTVLDFVVGPNQDAVHKLKDQPKAVQDHRRKVRISLVDGSFLDPTAAMADANKVPVQPFKGPLVKRGDDTRLFVPSLDPIRVAGKIDPSLKSK